MEPQRITLQTSSSHNSHKASNRSATYGFDDLSHSLNEMAKNPMTWPRLTYGLYAIASVTGIPMLIGLIFAYVVKRDAPEWLDSHYQFLIRTFWYGMVLIAMGVVTWIFAVGMFMLWALPVWYVARIVRGWMLLENQKPISDPQSWLFG